MNKKTALENLLFESGLNQVEFAKKVGVKLSTFRAQLKQKKVVDLALQYGRILGADSIKGYAYGVYYEIVLK